MRVRVEEPVPEHHRHPGVREPVGDVATLVRPHRREVEVGDLRPAQVLERQDPGGRVLPDHLRDDHLLVAGEVAVERLGVARLVAVVQLEPDRARELVDELLGIHELERLHPLAEQPRRLVEEPEVGLDLLGRGRALHLDRDLAAVGQDGAMDLADRRRRERREVELEECPIHAQVELCLDDVAHVLEGNRRGVVLEAAQLRDDVGRHHVRTRRQELTELDERRPELVQHHAEPLAAIGRWGSVPVHVARDEISHPVATEDVAEPVTGRDLRDLRETPEVARRLGRRHARDCRSAGWALAVALEQAHAMLELGDAEIELAHDLARRRPELRCRTRGRAPGRLAETRRLAPPALDARPR